MEFAAVAPNALRHLETPHGVVMSCVEEEVHLPDFKHTSVLLEEVPRRSAVKALRLGR